MKIGILTLPLHTNYGGILQAYAMQLVLTRLGHDPRIIASKQQPRPGLYAKFRMRLSRLSRFAKQILVPDRFSNNTGRHTSMFVNKWIKCDNYTSIDAIPPDRYDAIIVGSDQIWRQIYVEKSNFLRTIETSFLDFAKDWRIKRVSYAASFGTDVWEINQEKTQKCAELIQLFDAVSVREISGIDLCSKYLRRDAVQLLDPTLLLSKDDYLKLITKRYSRNRGIMTYILDESNEKDALVKNLMKTMSKPVFQSNISYDKIDSHARGCVQPPLEKWLQAFQDADIVVTDSFHACVFSIIFNKPFIAVPNVERGASRFYSLLKLVGQDFRIVDASNPLELTDEMLQKPNCDLSQYQKQSLDFLTRNLK